MIRATNMHAALRVAMTCRLRSHSLGHNIQNPSQSRTVASLLYQLPNHQYKGFHTFQGNLSLNVVVILSPDSHITIIILSPLLSILVLSTKPTSLPPSFCPD